VRVRCNTLLSSLRKVCKGDVETEIERERETDRQADR